MGKTKNMKSIILLLFVITMSVLMETTAWGEAPEWAGDWEFTECWPHLSADTNNCIFYEISIRRDSKLRGSYEVTINTNGYMAMQRLQARGIPQGDKVSIRYVKSALDSVGRQYRQNANLLELKYSNGNITTEWKEFLPELDENQRPGVYFEKVQCK
ncbi:hypothetical protein KP004_14320 [Geomonas oryzisoli]|uniref:Uncharacterized protein n=1 Tax=Geomonas oryzisoli TaxID=2847992 RepID=A0ABX8J2B9_9BACT|nr:DUF5991 domain-containing protein [Geomonas oryzisoli]QWV92375.1 hypothetical protein KP004_14320 [Geomonas oryzisoli]